MIADEWWLEREYIHAFEYFSGFHYIQDKYEIRFTTSLMNLSTFAVHMFVGEGGCLGAPSHVLTFIVFRQDVILFIINFVSDKYVK